MGRRADDRSLPRVRYLAHSVPCTLNGGRRKVTKRQAIITQLVNRSATADFRAIKILLDIVRDIERQTEPSARKAKRRKSTAEARRALSAIDRAPWSEPREQFVPVAELH